MDRDPYWRLKPEGLTPPCEICSCPGSPPIVLQDHLSSVPIACLRCNGEIPPERIGFTEALAERIQFWRDTYQALYQLWLSSGEYEAWARTQLENALGEINVEGRAIVGELNKYRRTFYWWFQDGETRLLACPCCERKLTIVEATATCEPCSIAFGDNPILPTGRTRATD